MHINTYLFHYFYHGLNAFDLLARGVGEHTRGFVGKYCHVAVALLDVDAPDVGGGETSFLAQKTDDVALAQLVFLALADIEREHLGGSGRRKEIGRRKGIDAHVALDKIGDMLLGTEHEEGAACGFPTGCAPYPMHISILVHEALVDDDVEGLVVGPGYLGRVGAFGEILFLVAEDFFVVHEPAYESFRIPFDGIDVPFFGV